MSNYDKLLNSQDVISGCFSLDFLSAFSIAVPSIPAQISESFPGDSDTQESVLATLIALFLFESTFAS
jgi:hypothetical protein